jgi:hypothetical protein
MLQKKKLIDRIVNKCIGMQTYLYNFTFIQGFKQGLKDTSMPEVIVAFNNSISMRIFRFLGGLCFFYLFLYSTDRIQSNFLVNSRLLLIIGCLFLFYFIISLSRGLIISLYQIFTGKGLLEILLFNACFRVGNY